MELVKHKNIPVAARRRPIIDASKCISCKACLDACPNQAIEEPVDYCCAKCVKYCLAIEVPCHPVRMAIRDELCNGCGACISVCPYNAIGY
jgi:epoxyqueuosine reductase